MRDLLTLLRNLTVPEQEGRKSLASRFEPGMGMTETKRTDGAAQPSAPLRPRPGNAPAPALRAPHYGPPLRPGYRPLRTAAVNAVGPLPNTIIIGAMKCGTTSLHDYLSYHPSISMSRRKETNFFVHHQNWSRGLGWYRSHFSEANAVVGESSPNYARYPVYPGVPERMHRVVPDAKLILCVRDPIKRMVSHYVHSYSLGRENRPLEVAFRQRENNPYLLCSSYFYQLEQYLRFYDADQIKLVVLEDLNRDPLGTLTEVFSFLDVDPTYQDARFLSASKKMPAAATRRRSPLKSWMIRRRIKGFYWLERNAPWVYGRPIPTPELSTGLREELRERLTPDVAALRDFDAAAPEWRL